MAHTLVRKKRIYEIHELLVVAMEGGSKFEEIQYVWIFLTHWKFNHHVQYLEQIHESVLHT